MAMRVAKGLDDVPMAFKRVSEIRKVSDQSGSHWFDGETMAFFGTHFPNNEKVYAGRIFIASHLNLDGTVRHYNVHIVERSYSIREADGARMVEYSIQNAFLLTDAPTTVAMARAVAETIAEWELPEYFTYKQSRTLEWLVAEKVWNAQQRA